MHKKSRIGQAVALLLAVAAASPVLAQQATTDTNATVVITGSRIARPNLISSTPVLSVTPQAMTDLGINNFADMATQLTQFSAAFGESRTQSTFSGVGASGLNRANLRNLGPVRSLVLINGRRVPGGSSTSTAVDFNSIPTANIERVEVITGGASAVYGADAVAGVINIITRRNVQGVELSLSYGASERGDNENPMFSILAGGKFGDSGRATLTFQYDKQGQVSCADRYLCSEDFAWTSPTNATRAPTARSGIGIGGRFLIDGGAPTGYTRRNGSFTDAAGNLIPFSVATDGYNRNAQRDLAIPTTRVLVAGDIEYKLGRNTTAFGEFNFAQNSITSKFEGHPFQSSSDKFGGSNGLSPTIPVDNPFIPAALKAIIPASQTEIQWLQRFGAENIGGPRGADSDRNMARTVIGVKGELASLAGIGRDWRWEVSNTWGRTRVNLGTQGLVGLGQLYYGLRVEPDPSNPGSYRCTDVVARSQGCVPINPFAPYTEAMSKYLSLSSNAAGQSTLNSTVAHVNGVLTELPAGSLRVAAGVERRSISGSLDYDTVINNGLATGNQIQDVTKATTVTKEVFVEALVPLLADKPFVNSLNLETAYRHSSTRTGNYNTWKFGGDWEPISGLRFRAVKARAVRAPVAGDLSGGGETAGVVNDPCIKWGASTNAGLRAACAAAGIPDNYDPILLIQQGVRGFEGGNPNLKPEVATTLTYGFVWQPQQLKGLSLSVDRFDIKVDDVITTLGRQLAVDSCYSAAAQFCNNVRRGSTPLLPGANYVLLAVDDRNDNLAQIGVSGVDLEARYGFKLGAWGDLDTSMTATFYDEAYKVPRPGGAKVDLLDQAGGSTSDQGWIKRTASLNFTHRMGPLRTNWNMRHIGSAEMNTTSKAAGFPRIGAHTYHNVRVGYQVNKTTEMSFGVTNLFDKKPPFFGTGRAGTQALDTIPAYYDVFGRSYSANLRMKF